MDVNKRGGMETDFYLDEECVVGFWIGEIGWFLQRYQGYLRYQKHKVYPNRKFLLFCNRHLHVFVNDYVYGTTELPSWFKELPLEGDCYEAVPLNSPPGYLTPPDVYSRLIADIRKYYNPEKAIEMFPMRGVNYWVDTQLQVFCQYKTDKIIAGKPIVVVFPRARARAAHRNIPTFVWYELVENLKKTCIVVLAGTPNGACLVDYEAENVINLINYNEPDKTEKIITYLNSAQMSVSSQSGGTHISLLAGCPSYIIGHEMERHSQQENRLNTPTSFRTLQDYRAIDAYTMLQDMDGLLVKLKESGWVKPVKEAEQLIKDDTSELMKMIKGQRA